MTNWRQEIFAHFSHGHATNAYTEAVNGIAKLIARTGRGYSFEAIRAKVLFGNGLKLTERPKYDKSKVWAFSMPYLITGVVELEHYTSLGNEISTLISEMEANPEWLISTSNFE